MSIYQHLVIHVSSRRAEAVASQLLEAGVAGVQGHHGGRLFGVFKSEIGLSRDHLVLLIEWPDLRTATSGGPELLFGIDDLEIERDEVWEPTLRPDPGAVIEPTEGVFSHRWFDVGDADAARFLELSDSAWGDWEADADNYVLGLWRSRSSPAPDQTRFWLMAWYRNLAAWEGSRYWNRDAAELGEGNTRLSERNQLVVDRGVSMLWRLG